MGKGNTSCQNYKRIYAVRSFKMKFIYQTWNLTLPMPHLFMKQLHNQT